MMNMQTVSTTDGSVLTGLTERLSTRKASMTKAAGAELILAIRHLIHIRDLIGVALGDPPVFAPSDNTVYDRHVACQMCSSTRMWIR